MQSQIIAEKLKDFSLKHNLKLYTFARDVAASGGYMVLGAGDHVVADSSSVVGSIGVVFQKLKLKGLIEQFQIDHKHFASNGYAFDESENSYTICCRLLNSWIRPRRTTSNGFASRRTPALFAMSRGRGAISLRTTPLPFPAMSLSDSRRCREVWWTK